MASTTTKRGSKKPMSFGMILGITGGGFILIMIIAYMVMVPSAKQDAQVTQTRTVTQTTQMANNGQPLPNQPLDPDRKLPPCKWYFQYLRKCLPDVPW